VKALVLTAALVAAATSGLAAPPELRVEAGGPPEDPAYLPVHAARALGTFEAEGVAVTLRRAKHPAEAMEALREGRADVAVTTLDQAVRGGWARATPVRVLLAHTASPAAALLVSPKHQDRIRRVEDLRGQKVGIPGPGTTGYLALAALLAARRMDVARVQLTSPGGAALAAGLGDGTLAAALVEEPWLSRILAGGAGAVLVDLRSAEDTVRHLGGPFYGVVSVARADEQSLTRLGAALEASARAIIRVQAWLATTEPEEVADTLPPDLVPTRERFLARLAAARTAIPPGGEATEAGLGASVRVLKAGSPWPVTLKLAPSDLREPGVVTTARTRLGPTPPAP
jgi:NitT/TauT family transport system substrate-binding protein